MCTGTLARNLRLWSVQCVWWAHQTVSSWNLTKAYTMKQEWNIKVL